MNLCLFEDDKVAHLLPLVYTRAVFDLRLGIRTLLETTRDAFDNPAMFFHARPVAAQATARNADLLNRIPDGLDVLFVNGRFIAEPGPVLDRLKAAARSSEHGRIFVQGDDLVAVWFPEAANALIQREEVTRATFEGLVEEEVEGARFISRTWHLLDELAAALTRDYAARTKGYYIYEREQVEIRDGVHLVAGEQIYIAPGAVVRTNAVLNAENGPIFIDRNAVIKEAAVIHGPAYIGAHTQVNVGAHIEGSSVGPVCKVGGAVHESVLHSYSNKAHTGFVGNSYLGSWCNMGSDSTTSDLRNDYRTVPLYNLALNAYEPTGRQFVGLIMGDHSKCGINTMFNTGSVVGVNCNIFGTGYPPCFIPSFSWGSAETGFQEYHLEKALEVAQAVMARRNMQLSETERDILSAVFDATRAERAKQLTGKSAT